MLAMAEASFCLIDEEPNGMLWECFSLSDNNHPVKKWWA